MMADPTDEDGDLRSHLAAFGPDAIGELRRVLEAPSDYRTSVLHALTARPAYADLATLIAMADTDEVVRLRLLRAIKDMGVRFRVTLWVTLRPYYAVSNGPALSWLDASTSRNG